MSELRKDVITREWVIIAAERARRPSDFISAESEKDNAAPNNHAPCPFDAGNEHLTPPEIVAYRPAESQPDSAGWWVRVVPNKYPALAIENQLHHQHLGIYEVMLGFGAHEVIIETPEHATTLGRMPLRQVEEVVWMYRDRYLDLKKDPRLQYIMLFRNHGKEAGASIDHPHSQLIATPVIPRGIANELWGAQRYAEYRERCAYCDIVATDMVQGERVVAETPLFLSVEPYASRYPLETWILPKRHCSSFGDIDKDEIKGFAAILKETLTRIDLCLSDPPYNFFVHTAPCNPETLEFETTYHWHLEIIPRLTIAAGFELGTVTYINVVAPEDAARFLRDVNLEQAVSPICAANDPILMPH